MDSPPQVSASGAKYLAHYDMRENSFDTIRLLAALAVILSHAFPLTGAAEPLETLTNGQATIGLMAVSIFFLISGYLIPASLDRGTLSRYASKRALRIMPALIVAVAICSLVIGPLVTSLSASDYFAARQTWIFLGHAFFLPVGFDLPGVFKAQPESAVNGSLWSLKYEVACYVIVPIAFAFARFRLPVVVAGWLASFAIAIAIPHGAGGVFHYLNLLAEVFRFFGAGMLFYLLSHRVVMRRDWAIVAAVACGAAAFTPVFVEIMATLGAYAIIYFAYSSPQGFRDLTARGDISYGVYVYAFPIQQLLVPISMGALLGGAVAPWLANVALALPLAMLAGVVSWVLVEKPFLLLGKRKPVRPALS